MNKAFFLSAIALALMSPVLQAADRLQVNTEVMIDGKVVQHMTAYVGSGEKIHYSRAKTHEVMTVAAGKPHKKLEPIGFEGDITPRITPDGEVLITCSASYVGVAGNLTGSTIASDITITDLWRQRLGTTRLGDLGERIPLDRLEQSSSGHTVEVAVTVNRS
ncbi:hypothetical protein [Pseudomonas mosselii]|uniref:hypothetical protein n=1 Tax=Pseudomonas mosselii TaxID=78327 RepID=UPI0021D8D6D3|nr:hypothetical protein [Pseudomonas mosselii]MCU9527476.1 hypothetical protein [Pseudomonas mosselii]MCU9534789.1 hypothetical protein [Pseudomonas mosselii]MCU9542723.1 hypothetical protein [Pseudomonas mosselii]MCU9546629.1 hypothetical protein [Pseudomonas mosselii]